MNGDGFAAPRSNGAGASTSRFRCSAWAMMPDHPKLDAPAAKRRGAIGSPSAGMNTSSPRTARTSGFNLRSAAFVGDALRCRTWFALTRPETPAAASAWPQFALTPPTSRLDVGDAKTAAAPETSMGSPSGVPVPCCSRNATLSAVAEPSRSAAFKSRCWLSPFSAVKDADRPLCFAADPKVSVAAASKVEGSWCDSSMAPPPSPRTKPSARSSMVWQRPVAEFMPMIAVPRCW